MSLTVYFDRIVFNADEVFSKDKKNKTFQLYMNYAHLRW